MIMREMEQTIVGLQPVYESMRTKAHELITDWLGLSSGYIQP